MALSIVSRKEALASSAKFYFTGKPCSRGHLADRVVGDRQCVECRREISKRHAAKPERKRYQAQYCRRADVKARIKLRNLRPDVVVKRKAYLAEYNARPEVRAQKREGDKARKKVMRTVLGSKDWFFGTFHHAKERAAQAGLPFDREAVRELLLNPPTHCPVFGWQFKPGGKRSDDSPSIDRIKPHLGYVRGNIALISFKANRIKTDATAAEVRAVADWLDKVSSPAWMI